MNNKYKRSSIRKDFLKEFNEKDFFSCIEKAEKIITLYDEQEKNSVEYCTDLYNLAYIQQNLGKYNTAIKFYKKVLKTLSKEEYDIEKKQDVELIKFIIETENNLGVCYTRSIIRQNFSMKCFQRALDLSKKYIKDINETTLNILHNIGSAYYDLQQYEDAIYNHLQELSYRKEKNMDFIDNLNFLGYSYEKLEKYDEAIGYFNQALDSIKGLFGINSEEYISNTYYIASVYCKMGNYELGIKSYKTTCSLIEQKLGNGHPYLAEVLSRLAQSYLRIDKLDEALKAQLKALKIVKETVGEKHMFYASNLKKVGDIYYILGQFDKCLFYYENENKIKEDIIGIYNEEYVNSLLNLINIFIKTDNVEKQKLATDKLLKMIDFDLSKKSYEKAILILCKIYISNDLSDSLYDIYEAYKYVNDVDTFDIMIKKAKQIDEDIINKDKKLSAIFNTYEEEIEEDIIEEDIVEDIFGGIKNLFDGIKKEIDEIEKNKQKSNKNKEKQKQDKYIEQSLEDFMQNKQDEENQDENI